MLQPFRLRIAWSSVYWRAFLAVAVLAEIGLYFKLRPWLQHRSGGFWIAAMVYKSPKPLGRALLWAGVITLAVDLYVQLVMKPFLAAWYAPKTSPLAGRDRMAFCLGAGDSIQDVCPARLRIGRRGLPGLLVRSDHGVWFAPNSWDVPVHRFSGEEIQSIVVRPARPMSGSLLQGTPDRLDLTGADGRLIQVFTADPTTVQRWLQRVLG